jgi:transcriptional regulator with XRE-family HTH domain
VIRRGVKREIVMKNVTTALTFGEWVRNRREELGLSLRAFALATGMDPGNLSRYELGLLPPPQDPDTLASIARALTLDAKGDEYQTFLDLAALGAGRIPPDLAENPEILARMPFLFRTARGKKLTRDQLIALADSLKRL